MAREGIQLAYPFEEKRLLKWNPPYIVQPKLDGERCRAIWSERYGYVLVSSEFNTIISVPHINKALGLSLSTSEIDGELYIHGLSFEEIHSRVSRTVNLHPNYEEVEYHVFDVIDKQPQVSRLLDLKTRFLARGPVKIVPFVLANNLQEVMDAYEGFLKDGYEGIIVRHPGALYRRARSPYMMKFKPKKSDTYIVVGFKEEIDIQGVAKDALGALVCTSDEGTTFSVGSGFTREQRETYWEKRNDLIGKSCHVQYQHITSGKGVPRFPVFLSVED